MKTQEPRNGMQMSRHDIALDFHCCKCGKDKKAKNIAVELANPENKICNGCYGQILAGE